MPGPGGVARVCVGDRYGAHGSIWRIWVNRSTSDVYIACRDIAEVQKWSLHQSGDWRHQWETRQYALHLTNRDDRLLDQWNPPKEFEEPRWTKAFSIQVRHQDLVDYGDGVRNPDGRKAINTTTLAARHNDWLAALPTLRNQDATEFDKDPGGAVCLPAFCLRLVPVLR